MQIKSTFGHILSTNGDTTAASQEPATRQPSEASNTMKNTAPPRALRGQGFTGAAPPTASE